MGKELLGPGTSSGPHTTVPHTVPCTAQMLSLGVLSSLTWEKVLQDSGLSSSWGR